MKITDLDFIELAQKVRKDTKRSHLKDEADRKIETKEYYDSKEYKVALHYISSKYYREFLQHCIPYLAQVPVVSNKPTECLNKLKSLPYVEVHGEPYSSNQLLSLIIYLTHTPRSAIVCGKMTEGMNARYGTLTPLLMFALKESRGIPYEYWDKQDQFIKYFLTSTVLCETLLESKLPELPKEDILKARSLYGDATQWRVTGFNKLVGIEGCKDLARHIIFQTWLACPAYRDTETMILDVHNWDMVPEPYDTNVAGTARIFESVNMRNYKYNEANYKEGIEL